MASTNRRGLIAAMTLSFGLVLAAPAVAGPPWISVEYPANPFDEATRGALALIHTYHHGRSVSFPLEAVAEGFLDGGRTSRDLRVVETSRAGVYAVRGDLPAEGVWVLVVEIADTEVDTRVTALVALDENREITAVRVPHRVEGRWIIPRAASTEEVEALLASTAALAQARRDAGLTRTTGVGTGELAGLGALVLLPLGAFTLGRRRARGRPNRR